MKFPGNRPLDNSASQTEIPNLSFSGDLTSYRNSGWKEPAILVGITLLCLLPFIGKAFHIDDPLFVWCGKQIQEHPLDPFGFTVNWFGIDAPMSTIMRNPPLTLYYMAFVGSIAGWSEIAVHSAFLIPAILSVLGIYALAKHWCTNPLLAALISLMTPVFLVSATTVMCDVMMLAFEVWTIVFWVRAHDTMKMKFFLLSTLMLAGCIFSKFTGLTILPLLIVYSILRTKKIILSNLWLILPVTILIAYLFWFQSAYGAESIWYILTYGSSAGSEKSLSFLNLILGLSFIGGCFIPVLFFTPFLFSRNILIVGSIAIAIIIIQIAGGNLYEGTSLPKILIESQLLGTQFILFCLSVIVLLSIVAKDFIKNKDAISITLGLLVMGTIVFAIFLSWSISGRYLLPLTPAVGILIARATEKTTDKRWLYALIIPVALIALLVTAADFSMADATRTAAEEISSKYNFENKTLWFQGHWGFQYYMEKHHNKPLDGRNPQVKPGEFIIFPLNNSVFPMNSYKVKLKEKMEYPVISYIATMSPSVGGGFYANIRGPFPFAFGEVAKETYYVLEFHSR